MSDEKEKIPILGKLKNTAKGSAYGITAGMIIGFLTGGIGFAVAPIACLIIGGALGANAPGFFNKLESLGKWVGDKMTGADKSKQGPNEQQTTNTAQTQEQSDGKGNNEPTPKSTEEQQEKSKDKKRGINPLEFLKTLIKHPFKTIIALAAVTLCAVLLGPLTAFMLVTAIAAPGIVAFAAPVVGKVCKAGFDFVKDKIEEHKKGAEQSQAENQAKEQELNKEHQPNIQVRFTPGKEQEDGKAEFTSPFAVDVGFPAAVQRALTDTQKQEDVGPSAPPLSLNSAQAITTCGKDLHNQNVTLEGTQLGTSNNPPQASDPSLSQEGHGKTNRNGRSQK